jgi:hypothetical protein
MELFWQEMAIQLLVVLKKKKKKVLCSRMCQNYCQMWFATKKESFNIELNGINIPIK